MQSPSGQSIPKLLCRIKKNPALHGVQIEQPKFWIRPVKQKRNMAHLKHTNFYRYILLLTF